MNYDKTSFLKGVETGRKLFRKFGDGTHHKGTFDGQPIPYLDEDSYPDNSQALFEAGYIGGVSHNATIEGVVPEGVRGDLYYSFCVRSQYDSGVCYVCGYVDSSTAYFSALSLRLKGQIVCTLLLRTETFSYYYTLTDALIASAMHGTYRIGFNYYGPTNGIIYRSDEIDGDVYCPEFSTNNDACLALCQYVTPQYISFDGQPMPVLDSLSYPDNSAQLFNAGLLVGYIGGPDYQVSVCSRSNDDCYMFGTTEMVSDGRILMLALALSPTNNAVITITSKRVRSSGIIYSTSSSPSMCNLSTWSTYFNLAQNAGSYEYAQLNVPEARSFFDAYTSLNRLLNINHSNATRNVKNQLRLANTASYDNTSFLAGLAVGRALWKPRVAIKPAYDGYILFHSDRDFTVGFGVNGASASWDGQIEYSTDGVSWSTWLKFGVVDTLSSADGKLYLRGIGNRTIGNYSEWYSFISGDLPDQRFVITSRTPVYCDGNIEALLDYQSVAMGIHPDMGTGSFHGIFGNCTSLVSAPKLPAVSLTYGCYESMFQGTSITEAPKLPATHLAIECYEGMFNRCTKLTKAPALPATQLAKYCYEGMFYGCTELFAMANLPASTLAVWCYSYMYYGCSKIKVASTQGGIYQYPFYIPQSSAGGDMVTYRMLRGTGGTYTGNSNGEVPQGTYYTTNPLV